MEDDPFNQSWVTIASDDEHVWYVLLLLQSLRRSFTTRYVTLLITDSISSELRTVLINEFDFVININSDRFKNQNYSDPNQLKLHCWNLIEFNKCVYIDPHIFVQKNCDELFTLDELSVIVQDDENQLISSVFVLDPKIQTYMDLLQMEGSKTDTDVMKEFFDGHPSNYNRLSEDIYFARSKKGKEHLAKLLTSSSLKGINMKCQIGIEPELATYLSSVVPCIKIVENIILQSSHVSQSCQLNGDIEIEKSTSPITKIPPQELADSIAVIGMSCRFPGANSPEEYWDFLCSGQDGITQFPSDRPIPKAGLTSETAYRSSRAGYLKCPIDEFDSEFFKISPREAESMSPQQRILLEVAWESLENSGINPEDLRGSNKTGVFVGNWTQYNRAVMPTGGSFLISYLGDGLCPTASRISYFLDLRGVSVAIESACSSSLNAIHTACESLRRRESDLSIACGVNILHEAFDPVTSPILSDDYKCKSFDKSANGFVRAEGCGVLVLKRFSDAWKNGDNILCAIRGSAMNNDGSSTSFGTPSTDGQVKVIKQALNNAKVNPIEVSFIEAHGTGTPVGDPIEFSALNKTYSGVRLQTLFIGSCKSNIGHTEAAAGIAGAIKIILCMKNKSIPPNLHFHEINPNINLNLIPCEIPSIKIPWNSRKRIAGLSSFGLGGNNVHMIMQETPASYRNCLKGFINTQIVTISAKSKNALQCVRSRYISFLGNSDNNLENISFTANTGRTHFQYRLAVCVNTVNELCTKLKSENYEIAHCTDALSHNIGFLFTGQGCEYVGMAIELWDYSTEFRKHFSRCDIIFHQKFGFSMLDVCRSGELLEKNIYSMPTAFSIQCCISKVWAHFGIRPNYVVGHSFGELAAAECAGIVSLEDAMHLAIERSILIDTIAPGAMLAIKSNYSSVLLLIKKFLENEPNMWIDIAAINSSEQVVVSAKSETLEQFEEFCTNNSVQTKRMVANYAFHSRDMDKILDKYKEKLTRIKHNSAKCVFVSSVFGGVTRSQDFNVEYWLNNLRNTVRFSDAIKVVTENCKIMIEVGTHPVLLPFAMTSLNPISGKIFCPSLRRNEKDLDCLCHSIKKLYMSGLQINWKAWHGNNKKYTRVPLPNTAFERKKFWVKHVSRQTALMNVDSKFTHPLLGYSIPSPSLEINFHCILSSTNFPWLEDHKIGENTILPGAVYLEIITAAGKLALIGSAYSKIHVTVEHFAIYTALLMINDSQIHTTVSSNYDGSKEGEVKVSVFTLEICSGYENWTKHADAIVSTKQLAQFSNIHIESIISNLNLIESIGNIYMKLLAHGYNFGPSFQSIKSIWMDSSEALAEIQLTDDAQGYICHPIILDAMLQTVAIHSHILKTYTMDQILIPVSIKQYIWLGEEMSGIIYCHFTKTNSTVYLYSDSGQLLGYIKKLEWICTTLESVQQILKTSSVHIPKFYIDTWVPAAQKSIVDATLFSTSSEASLETCKSILLANTLVSEDLSVGITEEISLAYLIRAIQECNLLWTLNEHTESFSNDWEAKLPSSPEKYKLREAYLNILQKQNYINANSYIIKTLPGIAQCNKIIEELTFKMKSTCFGERIELAQAEFDLVSKCGNQLVSVLNGKVTGLSVLFPQDGTEGAKEYYSKSMQISVQVDILSSLLIDNILRLRNQENHSVRILEIGGGTGSASVEIYHRLSEHKIPHTFVFTDISPYLLDNAKINFGSKFQYQLLNIENDPLSQGFSPHSFDIIVGSFVVHATKNINQSLEHLRMLIKPRGTLFLGEIFKQTVSDVITWGLLDGWWRFNDFRKLSPLIGNVEWNKLLLDTGFGDIQTLEIIQAHYGCIVAKALTVVRPSVNATKTWLAISDSKLQNMHQLAEHFINLNRNLIPVRACCCEEFSQTYQIQYMKKSVPDFIAVFEDLKHHEIEGVLCLFESSNSPIGIENIQTSLCGTLLHLTQAMYKYFDSTLIKPRLICVTRGVHCIGDALFSEPSMGTIWGFLKVFGNENPSYITKLIDLDQNNTVGLNESEINGIISQLWELDEERFIAFRNEQLFVQRLITMPKLSTPLIIPSTPRFMLNVPKSRSIDDISIVFTKGHVLNPNEAEIEVCASALNFRDLLVILKPDVFSLSQHGSAGLGLEISGKISSVGSQVTKWKIGDEIFGYVHTKGLASHVILPETQLIHKPKDMSFVRAAAFPIVFCTAYISLVEIANLSCTDNVLIHAAAGGVGIACIQIAKHIGATIFVTAGSHRKREYLRSLGLKYIYNSRNTDYKEFILKDTNGVGVDVVVNSLTTDTFKNATLDICAKNARFVEISKLNVWTTEEVMSLRPDISYTVFDLVITSDHRPKVVKDICSQILDTFPSDCYTKFPITVFTFENIKEALKYMKDAKHIGKIVVQLPRCSSNMLGIGKILKYDYFDKYSTYLITGGLGGIGLEVMKWMLSVGAHHIVLTSRNPPNENCKQILNSLNESNSGNVVVIPADVGIYSECVTLLDKIKIGGLPLLRGIMHAAGTLEDGMIPNQSWEKFTSVFKAKVYGGWYLHCLTKDYCLDYFVMFSSACCTLGTPGQSNHSAANYYLDSLAHYRNSLGLVGSTINWGAWSDVGAVTRQANQFGITRFLRKFNSKDGIAGLEKFISNKNIQSIICNFADLNLFDKYFKLGNFLKEMNTPSMDIKNSNISSQLEKKNYYFDGSESIEKIELYVEKSLKKILRIDSLEPISLDKSFSNLGLDSLMTMEFRNQLQTVLQGKSLPINVLTGVSTIKTLSKDILNILIMESKIETKISLNFDVIKNDSILPVEIKSGNIRPNFEFKNIFLTGSTGFLGSHFLSKISQAKFKIYCLIRCKSKEEGLEKLIICLQKHRILDLTNFENISILSGDLTTEYFGLSSEEYFRLATDIDLIIHSAAKVNHIEGYEDNVDLNNLRSQHLNSMINILKFAGTNKTKLIFYTSSFFACTKVKKNGLFSEEYPDEDEYGQNLVFGTQGYRVCKLVCEKLINQAAERGIPCIVMRYPSLLGNNKTSTVTTEKDHLWAFLLSFLAIKKIPLLYPFYPFIPVDIAVEISMSILLNERVEMGVYNLTPHTVVTNEILQEMMIQKLGMKDTMIVPYSEWRKELFELPKDLNPLLPFEYLYDEVIEGSGEYCTKYHDHLKQIKFDELSEKVIRNFPNVKNIMVESKIFLEQCIRNYLLKKVT